MSWAVTEPAIYYQAACVKLLFEVCRLTFGRSAVLGARRRASLGDARGAILTSLGALLAGDPLVEVGGPAGFTGLDQRGMGFATREGGTPK